MVGHHDFPNGQVQKGWNATFTPSGSSVTRANAGYNGALAAGANTTFGFLGTGGGQSPILTCTAS